MNTLEILSGKLHTWIKVSVKVNTNLSVKLNDRNSVKLQLPDSGKLRFPGELTVHGLTYGGPF